MPLLDWFQIVWITCMYILYICMWTESWSSGVWDQAVWRAGVLPAGGGEQSGGEGDSELTASPRASRVSLQRGQEEGEDTSTAENTYMCVRKIWSHEIISQHDIKKPDMLIRRRRWALWKLRWSSWGYRQLRTVRGWLKTGQWLCSCYRRLAIHR